MTLDEGKAAFDALKAQIEASKVSIDNEAEARFKIIDQVLSNVLGWHRLEDFSLERYSAAGYADYVMKADGRARMVVEAKRSDNVLIGTRAQTTQFLTANSSALHEAQAGMRQAQSYCVTEGTPFALLTNGFEWIAYLAIRERGKKPSEGKVIVFPCLNAVAEDFALFWDLFSRQSVLQEIFKIRILEKEGVRIQAAEQLRPLLKNAEIKYLQKSKIALDLEQVFREFFSSMAGQNDPEMLAECFVESKESKEADVSLEKITNSLLSRLELISSDEASQLQLRMEGAVESQHGEFVLIVGNKGAGKTTFIDRFFRLVLPPSLRQSCTVIRVDVGDATGSKEAIVPWLDHHVLEELEQQLFEAGCATNDQLQGIFFSEYTRWKEGPHKVLYDTDKAKFKIKFGEYLEGLRKDNTHQYIEKLLEDVVKNRKKMPCVVFDNTDHFDERFQEIVFQYAQSIFRSVFSFVICPITDRTIWQLSKAGPMQSYDTTSYYLPVPAMKSVLEKRVTFIRRKLDDKGARGEYFLSKGIRLNVADINAFAACIEEIFITNEGLSRYIGSLANFDIRRSLQLSQDIVTSPHIKVDELVKLYLTDGHLSIKSRSIYSALICGDTNHYVQNASHFVVNVFEIKGDDLTSPLLGLTILQFFIDIENSAGEDVQASHASVEQALIYLGAMGFPSSTTKTYLQRLSDSRLLATYDASEQHLSEDSRLRITPSGRIHYEWATGNPSYLTETTLVTPLRSCIERDELLAAWTKGGKMTREDWEALMAVFAKYCLTQDATFASTPLTIEYKNQTNIRTQFRNRWLAAYEQMQQVNTNSQQLTTTQ